VPRLAGPDARALFAGARTATLGSTGADGRPHLVPCVFAVDGDQVYSAVDGKPKSTRQLRRLANIAARAGVSMLADHYDEDWARLWWVRADGDAVIVTGRAAMAGPLRLLAARRRSLRCSTALATPVAIRPKAVTTDAKARARNGLAMPWWGFGPGPSG
jgi:PPOX class probable F420-dependent enzyme